MFPNSQFNKFIVTSVYRVALAARFVVDQIVMTLPRGATRMESALQSAVERKFG